MYTKFYLNFQFKKVRNTFLKIGFLCTNEISFLNEKSIRSEFEVYFGNNHRLVGRLKCHNPNGAFEI